MGKKGGSSSSQRALSKEEIKLFDTQEKALAQATQVSADQYNLSKVDREYITQIYRGDLNPNDPKVKEEVAKRLANTPPPTREQYTNFVISMKKGDGKGSIDTEVITENFDLESYDKALAQWETNKEQLVNRVSIEFGDKGVDELLFDAVKESKTVAGNLINKFQADSSALGKKFTDSLTGISDKFRTTLETKSAEFGTADTDILATTKGQNLAGISQSYQEAIKQAQGVASRRGLAGSGVEGGITGTLLQQEAQAKAQALSQSNLQAIGISDQRRQQQIGVAGQVAQLDSTVAGQQFQTNLGLATSHLQNQLGANQQNIANLQLASGISQGTFLQSQNFLNQAGSTANQTAQTAGSTANQIGANNLQFQQQQQQNQGGGLLGGILSAGLSAGVGALTGGLGTGLAASAFGAGSVGANAIARSK